MTAYGYTGGVSLHWHPLHLQSAIPDTMSQNHNEQSERVRHMSEVVPARMKSGDDLFVSLDNMVRVRVQVEPEGVYRVVCEGGTFTDRRAAKQAMLLLGVLLTGPDGFYRSLRKVDAKLFQQLLDAWDHLEKRKLTKLLNEAEERIAQTLPLDVSEFLDEPDLDEIVDHDPDA